MQVRKLTVTLLGGILAPGLIRIVGDKEYDTFHTDHVEPVTSSFLSVDTSTCFSL